MDSAYRGLPGILEQNFVNDPNSIRVMDGGHFTNAILREQNFVNDPNSNGLLVAHADAVRLFNKQLHK